MLFLPERVPEKEALAAAECLAAVLHYELCRLGLPVEDANRMVLATIADARASVRRPR